MGDFAKLPSEIRLLIWEYYLFNHRGPGTCTCTGAAGKTAPGLSILRASRSLYNEISHHLYTGLRPNVLLTPRCFWITINMKGKKRDFIRAKWRFNDEADAIHHGFQNFPYHKVDLIVNIYAPDPNDPGELVRIWQKTNTLARLIGLKPTPNSLKIYLPRFASRDWGQNGQTNDSAKYPESPSPYDYYPDTRIASTPFQRFEKLRPLSYKIYCVDFVKKKHDHVSHKLSYTPPHDDSIEPNFTAGIDREMIDLSFFLDTKLDSLEGQTADLLRLERFSEWFEDGQGWDSAYEKQILFALRRFPDIVLKHDMGLCRLIWRHQVMVRLHLALQDRAHALEPRHAVKYCHWSRKIWSEAFPNGLPVLSADAVTISVKKHFCDKYKDRYYSGHSSKEYYLFMKETGLFLSFFNAIHKWIARRTNTPCSPWVSSENEDSWCSDCRGIGFRFGCNVCDR
ncbi:hypothetical protein V8E54_011246 [Elaphomyces granulatus]